MLQKTKVFYLFTIVFTLAFAVASLSAMAKNDNAKNDNSNKSSQSEEKNNAADLTKFETPDKAKGETDAQVNKEKTESVAKTLKELAKGEKAIGNAEVSNQIQEAAIEQEQIQAKTTDAIEQVETRGKVKTFLLGSDYKNLGQLRSNLVQNRNQIRKLTQTMNKLQNSADVTVLQEQLTILMQERERIKNFITTNESNFSLFGWVSRFLTNYEKTPINEQEEKDLTDEVEEAILLKK